MPKLETAKRVFKAFQANYGLAWAREISTEEIMKANLEVWEAALEGVSKKSIDYALNNLPAGHKPPRLPAFKALCFRSDYQQAGIAVGDAGSGGTKTPEIAQNYLGQIRKILKGGRVVSVEVGEKQPE